jgi:predicted transcriptional regulator
METIGKIRRRHKVRGESISAIARDLNLSRNTVKKYLKAEIDLFTGERASQPRNWGYSNRGLRPGWNKTVSAPRGNGAALSGYSRICNEKATPAPTIACSVS